jgi:phosphoesterase RecJ-like protein
VTHARPDGDALASALGLRRLCGLHSLEATVLHPEPLPKRLRFLPGAHEVQQALPELNPGDLVVVLDAGTPRRLPASTASWLQGQAATLLVVDHHDDWAFDDRAVPVHDPEAACTGELVYRLAVEAGTRLDPMLAQLLLVSLYSDTGGFRYACTTWRSMEVASHLYRTGVDAWSLSRSLYESEAEERARLHGCAMARLQRSACGRVSGVLVGQRKLRTLADPDGALEGLVNRARAVVGTELAFEALEERPRHWRVHFRSAGRWHAARTASALGARGGPFAASALVQGRAVEVCARLLALASQAADMAHDEVEA